MSKLESIFKIYGIKEALLKENDRVEIIILKRVQNLNMNRWLNFVNSLKSIYHKEIDFLLENEALDIYSSLEKFTLFKENYHD
jgi:hypothetical protein